MWNRITIKWILALFVAVNVWFSMSECFAQAEKPRISLSVKPQNEKSRDGGSNEDVKGNTKTTTDVKTENEVCTLEIKVKNNGEQPVSVQLEWCFVSKHSSGKTEKGKPEKAKPEGFSPGKKTINVPAGDMVAETVISAPFMYEEKTVRTEAISGKPRSTKKDTETGDVYKGYLVLVTADGDVIAKNASVSMYLTDEWIEKCRNPPKAKADQKDSAAKKTTNKK